MWEASVFTFSPPSSWNNTPQWRNGSNVCSERSKCVQAKVCFRSLRPLLRMLLYNLWLYTNGCTGNGFKRTGALSNVRARGLPRQRPGRGFFAALLQKSAQILTSTSPHSILSCRPPAVVCSINPRSGSSPVSFFKTTTKKKKKKKKKAAYSYGSRFQPSSPNTFQLCWWFPRRVFANSAAGHRERAANVCCTSAALYSHSMESKKHFNVTLSAAAGHKLQSRCVK